MRQTRAPAAAHVAASNDDGPVPSLIVFDLDACVWLPEMYQLSGAPEGMQVPELLAHSTEATALGADPTPRAVPGWDESAGGVRAGADVVRLFPGALHALNSITTEPRFSNTRIGLASSTSKPDYARAVLEAYRLRDGSTFVRASPARELAA
jgi:hypothetical protein